MTERTPLAELSKPLLDHLRVAFSAPGLCYAEPPTPITGGYDTQIFGFRLAGAAAPLSIPLILRVLAPQHPPARALCERAIQNAVAGLGYPAPRVLLASVDAAILGGPFLVMERAAGRPLLGARRLAAPAVLADTQVHLHALDAEVVLEALDREGQASGAAGGPRVSRDAVSFEAHLAHLQGRIAGGRLPGLEPAMDWLLAHRPGGGARRVVCHGDFHPQNILVAGGRVTGVIDWPNAIVAEPAFDVAATRVILSLVPLQFLGVPAPLRHPVEIARRIAVSRYVRRYRRHRSLDRAQLSYYEALACLRGLVRVVGARLAAGVDGELNPLDASTFGERLAAHFAHVTGIRFALPAVPGRARRAPSGL